MIRHGSTYSGRYDRLFLGRVIRVRERTATMNVRAHVGPAPDRARIKNGGLPKPVSLILRDRRRYGLVAGLLLSPWSLLGRCGPMRIGEVVLVSIAECGMGSRARVSCERGGSNPQCNH